MSETPSSPQASATPADEALRWFVRTRASDFSDAESQELNRWLSADPANRQAFADLRSTWRELDGIKAHLPHRKVCAKSAAIRPRRPAWLLPLGSALASAALLVAVLVPHEDVILSFDAPPGEHREITLADGSQLALDADSKVTVTESIPPRIILLQGSAYIDVNDKSSGQLEVRVGATRIRDIGTHFSVSRRADRGSVAVAEGQVEVMLDQRLVMVTAGHGVDFDANGIVAESVIAANDVAPWRLGLWHFNATPLAEVAGELARQQRIQLDFPDAKVAALTVSGSFPIREPDKVLWAVAQVHALKLKRLGDRHYELRRG